MTTIAGFECTSIEKYALDSEDYKTDYTMNLKLFTISSFC